MGTPFLQNPGPPEATARSLPWALGPLKNLVLCRNGFHNPDFGKSRDPNGLYGVQDVFGRASFPPAPTKTFFQGISLMLGAGPWSPVFPIFALCGPKGLHLLLSLPGPCPWSLVPGPRPWSLVHAMQPCNRASRGVLSSASPLCIPYWPFVGQKGPFALVPGP